MLTMLNKIISLFRKEYYLYDYQGKGSKSSYIHTFKARNMSNALADHLESFQPVTVDIENFQLEEGYNELVIYYNFEIDGEHHRYMLIKDKVFDMYYKSKMK